MKKIAIIGANEFQNKLVLKAKEMGLETHVFAWEKDAVAKENADFFYPISITDKKEILKVCTDLKINGICTIATDLAMPTVNYVAKKLQLVGNTLECTEITTNKFKMRKVLKENKLPIPWFKLVEKSNELNQKELEYPLIVKPIDRSGSRGITKVKNFKELEQAIEIAKEVSFEKKILIEEFIDGDEYSIESISQNGKHTILQITKKYTTGSPNFIEVGHLQPALLDEKIKEKINNTVKEMLSKLQIKNGASHSEIKINKNNQIFIIEVGGRMGGDFIGSDLVPLSTGIDFMKLVLKVALNEKIESIEVKNISTSIIRFIITEEDRKKFMILKKELKNEVVEECIKSEINEKITDSSNRNGYYILKILNNDKVKEILMRSGLK